MSRDNPSHPGETVLEDCIKVLGLTIADAAAHLEVDEGSLTDVCKCRAPITADFALRFEQAFGSTAEFWLRRQSAYDLAQARRSANGRRLKRIESAA